MTPAELEALAEVMRDKGVFKLTMGSVTIEMSGQALALAHAPPPPAPNQSADGPSPQDPRRLPEDDDDPMQYGATEGMPG